MDGEYDKQTYYDREGEPIPYREWQDRRDEDEYVCVVDEKIPSKDLEVKTSWIGIDVSRGTAPEPLIFQTVVYVPADGPGPSHGELGGMRYASEAEARVGHDEVVAAVMLLHDNNKPPLLAGIDWFEGRGDN